MSDSLEQAQQGDSQAFERVFRVHAESLWRTAMAVLSDAEDASDAMQETAVKAWRALPRFEGKSSLRTWLTRIMLRTCYDIRKRRHRHYSLTGAGDALGCARDEWESGERSDEIMDVRAALVRLSADDRLVLALFYGNDLPVCEIAELLGVTEGAARVRLSRARTRFKKAYLPQETADGAEEMS